MSLAKKEKKMDEQSFDDFIKNKLGSYEDPDFDESALIDFQNRSAIHYPSPWYGQSWSKIAIATGVLLLTLFNTYMLWTETSADKMKASEISTLDVKRIDSITIILNRLE